MKASSPSPSAAVITSDPVSQCRDAVEVSGIDGVTVGTFGVERVSDTKITVELEFEGNMDTDATLTFTVGADALVGYNGPALTTQIPVTANMEAVVASTAFLRVLTEATLHESVVTLTLSGGDYEQSGRLVSKLGMRFQN